MSMKNPMTLAGTEPATFRCVTQHIRRYENLNYPIVSFMSFSTLFIQYKCPDSHTAGYDLNMQLQYVDNFTFAVSY